MARMPRMARTPRMARWLADYPDPMYAVMQTHRHAHTKRCRHADTEIDLQKCKYVDMQSFTHRHADILMCRQAHK